MLYNKAMQAGLFGGWFELLARRKTIDLNG